MFSQKETNLEQTSIAQLDRLFSEFENLSNSYRTRIPDNISLELSDKIEQPTEYEKRIDIIREEMEEKLRQSRAIVDTLGETGLNIAKKIERLGKAYCTIENILINELDLHWEYKIANPHCIRLNKLIKEAYLKAIEYLKITPDASGENKVFAAILYNALYERENEYPHDASSKKSMISYCDQAYKCIEKLGTIADEQRLVLADNYAPLCPKKAIACLNEIASKSEKNKISCARIYISMGENDNNTVEQHYENACQCLEDLGSAADKTRRALANNYYELGNIYFKEKNYEKAKEIYLKAIQCLEKITTPSEQNRLLGAIIYNNLASDIQNSNDTPREIEQYCNKASRYLENLDVDHEVDQQINQLANNYHALAKKYRESYLFDDAKINCQKGIEQIFFLKSIASIKKFVFDCNLSSRYRELANFYSGSESFNSGAPSESTFYTKLHHILDCFKKQNPMGQNLNLAQQKQNAKNSIELLDSTKHFLFSSGNVNPDLVHHFQNFILLLQKSFLSRRHLKKELRFSSKDINDIQTALNTLNKKIEENNTKTEENNTLVAQIANGPSFQLGVAHTLTKQQQIIENLQTRLEKAEEQLKAAAEQLKAKECNPDVPPIVFSTPNNAHKRNHELAFSKVPDYQPYC